MEVLIELFQLLCISSGYFVIEENLLLNMVGFGQRLEVFLELRESAFLKKLCFIAMLIFLKGSHYILLYFFYFSFVFVRRPVSCFFCEVFSFLIRLEDSDVTHGASSRRCFVFRGTRSFRAS